MSHGIERRDVLKGATAGAVMALLRGEPAAAAASGVTSKRAFAANQTVTTVIPDRLYRIGCVVPAKRLSWLPADLDGFEPLNAYMLIDGDTCVLADMGMPIMKPAMTAALEMVGKRKVFAWFSRNEHDCIGNMGLVLGTCADPTLLFGSGGGILEWVNDPAVSLLEVRDFLGRIPVENAKNGTSKNVGSFDFDFFEAGSKQMILTQWAFEKSTGTLFTSESFGWRHLKTADSPVVVESAKDMPAIDTLAKEMVARMNWMRESHYPEYLARFENMFTKYDVQVLAPVHGSVIKGREAVAAHVKHALVAMRAASKLPDTERLRYV